MELHKKLIRIFGTKQTQGAQMARSFRTSFEHLDEFRGMYITPPGQFGCSHEFSAEKSIDGRLSHKAWILPGSAGTLHRGYPTIQLQKTTGGVYKTPCLITFFMWLDMDVKSWFSPITFTHDTTDAWDKVVTLIVGPDGYLRLQHVPRHNQQVYRYQASASNGGPKFPLREWVKIDTYLDTHPTRGYAKVWQNGALVSHADVLDRDGNLAQIHGGMYADPVETAGVVYNDALEVVEVTDESTALPYRDKVLHLAIPAGSRTGKRASNDFVMLPTDNYGRISVPRQSWPNTGGDVIRVSQMVSLDGGASWTPWGNFTARGGEFRSPDGTLVTSCGLITSRFPGAGNPNRKIRIEVETPIALDAQVEIEISNGPLELQKGIA